MLERRYTKEEIIAMYFNTFDFVNNAVGIESASRIYFNKTPKDLKVEEAAMFVGMPKIPLIIIRADLKKNQRASCYRTAQTDGTRRYYIRTVWSLKRQTHWTDFHPESANDGLAPYFRMVVAEQLKKWAKENKNKNGEEYNIYTDGLKIYISYASFF